MRFSLVTVIRREQATWLGALFVVAAIAVGQDLADPAESAVETGWLWALAAGALLYILAYAMKRAGRLRVEGR